MLDQYIKRCGYFLFYTKNGNLRRKLAKLNVNKFRWDYFTKIVIVIIFSNNLRLL